MAVASASPKKLPALICANGPPTHQATRGRLADRSIGIDIAQA
jgi:hypothetical protein